MNFIHLLFDSQFQFIRYSLLISIIAAIPFGLLGTLVVAKRISYLAGSLSHCLLGGIGLGLYLSQVHQISWMSPQLGAFIVAIVAALVIGYVQQKNGERADTIIGVIWAVGMAAGLLFIHKTPGYNDPMSYLFGNILLINELDILILSGLAFIITLLVIVFYRIIIAMSFDEEFTGLRGIPVQVFNYSLLIITSVSIVILVRLVGIVLIIALLTIPAAMAMIGSTSLKTTFIKAIIFTMLFNVLGLAVSVEFDLPTSPLIIILAAFGYLFLRIISKRRIN